MTREDCLSRKAVLDTLDTTDKFLDEDRTVENYKALLKECYEVLTPVTPPSEDCVSRQAIDQNIYDYAESNGLSYANMKNYILDTPSVTPTQKWISVNEKLPKEGETVLVCYQAQGGIAQSVCEWFDMPNRGIVWSTLCGRTPIAWMSLPEPYKAEMEDEE